MNTGALLGTVDMSFYSLFIIAKPAYHSVRLAAALRYSWLIYSTQMERED